MNVRAEQLVFGYRRGQPVLVEVDLRLERGELLALVGPNGCGKSTLLRLVAGLRAPWSGRVLLEDRDLRDLDTAERARRLAFLPQRVQPLYHHLAREVVELALPRGGWLGAAPVDRARVRRALEEADALALGECFFDELSGGERQRVLLAAMLAQGGEVLLLDEPTAALDLPHQVAIFDLLRRRADDGRAVLVATHDLNLASSHADRMVLIDHGRVVVAGSPEEVVCEAGLRPVFGSGLWIGPHPQGGRPIVLPPGRPRS